MNKNTKKIIVGMTVIVLIMLITSISYGIASKRQKNRISELEETVKAQEILLKEQDIMLNEQSIILTDTAASLEEKEQELNTCQENLKKKLNKTSSYRLTSYYPAETSNHTGSGLETKDFQVNEKGWYTYQGKLVLAGATVYLKSRYGEKIGKHYFRYYDNVLVEIDGIQYDGIILDSCGACSYVQENRLDLFVRDKDSVIDRGYKGKNMIKVVYK